MAHLNGEKDPKTKAGMLGQLVVLHGSLFSNEVYKYLLEYSPQSDARIPLLHLGMLNVTNNEEIYRHILQDMAPGKDRNSLLYEATGSYSPVKLLDFLEDLKISGYPEDDEQVARIIREQSTLGRPDITEMALKDMIARIGSRKIGESMTAELVRRQLNSTTPGPGSVPDVKTLTSEIPDDYKNYFAKTYYRFVLAKTDTYNYSDLVAKGVPKEILTPFVKELASIRGSQNGPVYAIANSADIQGEGRTGYLKAIASNWLQSDSISASREIGNLAPGKDRDILVSELVEFCQNNDDPESALKWASTMSDKALQEKTTAQVISKMQKKQ